jgi:hypothetical protein
MRNFTFTKDSIISFKAYGIGTGQRTVLTGINVPKITQLTVRDDFDGAGIRREYCATPTLRRAPRETVPGADVGETCSYLTCSECDKSFRRYRDLMAHEVIGKHRKSPMTMVPLQDLYLEHYQERYTATQFTLQEDRITVLEEMAAEKPTTPEMLDRKSWALQQTAVHRRYTPNVHRFLLHHFKEGKGKADPNKVCAAMSLDRQFDRSQLLDAKKIKAYFRTLISRQQQRKNVDEPLDNDEIESHEDEEKEQSEIREKQVLLKKLEHLLVLTHPISFDGKNLCQITGQNWSKMSKGNLIEIAKHLNITPKSKSTNAILTMAIKEKLSACSCQLIKNFKIFC